jgi:hypothetical protein
MKNEESNTFNRKAYEGIQAKGAKDFLKNFVNVLVCEFCKKLCAVLIQQNQKIFTSHFNYTF